MKMPYPKLTGSHFHWLFVGLTLLTGIVFGAPAVSQETAMELMVVPNHQSVMVQTIEAETYPVGDQLVRTKLKCGSQDIWVSARDQIWLVSARNFESTPCDVSQLEVCQLKNGQWEKQSFDNLVSEHSTVSMLTIENGGQSVKPGQVYALDAKAGDNWLEEAGLVQATDIKLRGALPMDIVWKQKGLLGTSEKNSGFVATHLKSNGEAYILVPNDVLVGPKKAIAGSLEIGIAGHQGNRRTIDDAQGETFTKVPVNSLIAEGANLASPFTTEEMRSATKPERCLVVRAVSKERNGSDQSGLTYFHYPIEPEEIGEGWSLTHFNGDRSVWHGAPVLSANDGKLIGILTVGDRETVVIPLPTGL